MDFFNKKIYHFDFSKKLGPGRGIKLWLALRISFTRKNVEMVLFNLNFVLFENIIQFYNDI